MSAKEVALAYFELSNQRDLSSIKELFDPDATYSSDSVGIYYGKADIMQMMERFFSNFPKLHWQIQTLTEHTEAIVEIDFLCEYQDLESNYGSRKGKETIVVNPAGLMRHVEVRT